jgi:hypothetical protein
MNALAMGRALLGRELHTAARTRSYYLLGLAIGGILLGLTLGRRRSRNRLHPYRCRPTVAIGAARAGRRHRHRLPGDPLGSRPR